MVDTARQLLDELMGRNRNLDPTTAKSKKIQWDDPEFCLYYLVKFCPHELFVNTRADLGQCTKLHDEEAKRLYDEARPSARKRSFEDEFLRFSNHMINEVDRKIEKGRQRLALMNKDTPPAAPPISKFQEQLNNMNARINKLINEAEEAGNRGDVEQAQGLMTLCDQLKEEKDALVKEHEEESKQENGSNKPPEKEFQSNEKQMEVCTICGAFLIVGTAGDAQQRIEDHLSGKQHIGYSKLRKAVEEIHQQRKAEREKEDKYDNRNDRHDRRRGPDFRNDRRNNRRDRSGDRNDQPRRRDDRDRHRDSHRDNRDNRDIRDGRDSRDKHRDKRHEDRDRRDRDRVRDRRHRSRSRSSSRR